MSLFRNRNYLILFSGQLVSTVGNNLFMLALPWYVFTLTGSKSALAMTGFFQTIPVFIGLFSGVFVDRWRKKRTLIVVDLLRALLSVVLFLITLDAKPPLVFILALVFCLQLVGTFFGPAMSSMMPLVLPREDIPKATGIQQSGTATASLGGMLAGGTLITLIGAPLLFLGNAISFVASVTSLFFVKDTETIKKADKKPSLVKEWKEGLVIIWRSKFVLKIVVAGAFVNFAGAPMDIVLTGWVKTVLHGSGYLMGFFGGAQLIGGIIGGLILGSVSKRVSLRALLIISFLTIGVSLSLFGLFPNFYWNAPWMFICGICEGTLNGALGAAIIQNVPREALGRVIGTLQSSMTIAQPLGMAVFGILMLHLSLAMVYVLIGLCSVISGLSFVLPSKDDSAMLSQSQSV